MKYEKGGFIDSLVVSIKKEGEFKTQAGGRGKTQSGDIPYCDADGR